MERAIQFFQKETSLWGPLSLLSTLAIGGRTEIPFDLLFLSLVGLYLSARLQLRGFTYSLVLLGITAAIKHALFIDDHLWQLGLEGSLGLAFFITALAFEERASLIDSLNQQMETRKAALENLEDEIVKTQESALAQQIALSEKSDALQKELEELQAEHSSILILNEVLRKTTARHMQESETLAVTLTDRDQQMALLKTELSDTQKDLASIRDSEALAIRNNELMNELNAARYAKEQTHQINETLARLYVRESFKAKEADQEASDLESQLSAARQEVQKIAIPLQEQLNAAQNEIATLTFQFKQAEAEAHQGRIALQRLTEVQAERNLRPQVELDYAQQKMVHLSQIEPLFKQLKKQFEEKNQVLQETRTHLFLTDTELQKLRMEKTTLELTPFPKEVERELHELGSQVEALEEENQQLHELITVLTDPSDAAKRKKKLKTQTHPEQELLF
ncbi:MAG TPA: hypothetical protein VLF94_03490 [Chlamydiales bacterium]|nr:hypothetical protein [Chlamydiales bacterium]